MKKKPVIALQLYSVRSEMEKDVGATLKRIAAMGYRGVEFAGYFNLSGKQLRAMLDPLKLACVGSHVRLEELENEFDRIVGDSRMLGSDRLIVPVADLSDMQKLTGRLKAVHAKAKAAGMRVGFHNHKSEFETADGRTKFDIIFSETPEDFLVQLDIGWAFAAGQNVPALLRKYGKRIETVHVKEYCRERETAAVGDGDINWPPLFRLMEEETAVKAYIVEHEKDAVGPMESVEACINNICRIRKLGA